MRYHLFQKFGGKMVKIKETSFLSTRGAVWLALNCSSYHFWAIEKCCPILKSYWCLLFADLNKVHLNWIFWTLFCKIHVYLFLHHSLVKSWFLINSSNYENLMLKSKTTLGLFSINQDLLFTVDNHSGILDIQKNANLEEDLT